MGTVVSSVMTLGGTQAWHGNCISEGAQSRITERRLKGCEARSAERVRRVFRQPRVGCEDGQARGWHAVGTVVLALANTPEGLDCCRVRNLSAYGFPGGPASSLSF